MNKITFLTAILMMCSLCSCGSDDDEPTPDPDSDKVSVWVICPWEFPTSGSTNFFIGTVVSTHRDLAITLTSADSNGAKFYLAENAPEFKDGGYYYKIYGDIYSLNSQPANGKYISGSCQVAVTDLSNNKYYSENFIYKQYKAPKPYSTVGRTLDGNYRLDSWQNVISGIMQWNLYHDLDVYAPNLGKLAIENENWKFTVNATREYPLDIITSGTPHWWSKDGYIFSMGTDPSEYLQVYNLDENSIDICGKTGDTNCIYHFKRI